MIPRQVASALLGLVGAFQLALAAGAPWGGAAWGGAHPGALPTPLRVSSAATAVVLLALVALVRASGRGVWRRRALTAGGVAFGCSAGLNALSSSAVERFVWAPVAAALAWSLLASREPRA